MLTKPTMRGHQWALGFTIHLFVLQTFVPQLRLKSAPGPQSASRTAGNGYWRFTCPSQAMIPGRRRSVAGAGSEPEVALSRLHKLPSPWTSGCSIVSVQEPVAFLSWTGWSAKGSPCAGSVAVGSRRAVLHSGRQPRVCRARRSSEPHFRNVRRFQLRNSAH